MSEVLVCKQQYAISWSPEGGFDFFNLSALLCCVIASVEWTMLIVFLFLSHAAFAFWQFYSIFQEIPVVVEPPVAPSSAESDPICIWSALMKQMVNK